MVDREIREIDKWINKSNYIKQNVPKDYKNQAIYFVIRIQNICDRIVTCF